MKENENQLLFYNSVFKKKKKTDMGRSMPLIRIQKAEVRV